MENYYKILNVPPTASASEIKRAFRKKAKELHPDIPQNAAGKTAQKANEQALLQLIRAYETLLDAKRRSDFDFLYGKTMERGQSSFDYRLWLKAQPGIKNKALLIFFDLFHNEEEEGIREFLQLRAEQSSLSLAPYLNHGDFMDCTFVLAEELSFRSEYYEAFLLLEQIILEEQREAYFRHFFPEVLLLARKLLREKIPHTIADDLALDCCEAALSFGLTKTDKAGILKQMAEIYYRMGDSENGNSCAGEAVRLNPRIRGILNMKKHYREYS